MEYDFTLIAVGIADLRDVPLDKVQAAGCDDSTVGSVGGRVQFLFTREAPTLNEAVGSAIVALKGIGIDAYLASVESERTVGAA